jgi:hypothetical protein
LPVGSNWRSLGPGERFEASGNHDLKVPFRKHRISVLPVEDFSLFGDANLPRKISDGLREYGRVGRSSSSSYGSTSPVKEPEFHIVLAGDTV